MFLPDQTEGSRKGSPGFFNPTEPPAKLAPGGVRQMVVGKITAGKDRVDQRKPCFV